MKQEIKLGQTDYTVLIFIPDSASTDGSGKTGLVAANLTVSGTRVETDNDVTVTDYTSSLNNLAALTTAHTDWGLLEVSNTLAPGLYRLDIADAIFASGAWSAVVYVMVTTSAAAASPMEFVLIPQAPIDGVLLAPTTHTSAVIPTVTTTSTATAVTTVNGLAAGVITAASIASDAITAAKIADGAIDANTFASGAITAAAIATGAVDADALAADAGTEIGTAVWATAARTLTASTNLGDLDDAVLAVLGTPAGASMSADIAAIEAQTDDIGTAGAGLTAVPWNAAWDAEVQSEVADALAVYDPPTQAELVSEINDVQTDVAAVKSDTAAILVDTGTTLDARIPAALVSGRMDASVGAMAANTLTASALAADAATEVAAATARTAMTESYAANGAAPTLEQAIYAMHQMLQQFAISGTTYTVRKLDNSTTAFLVTLDSATAPTSAVRT